MFCKKKKGLVYATLRDGLQNKLIDIQLQNVQHRLRLAGVVYYGQHHFTAQIILSDSDGQVWFYDGIDTGRNLV
jgi:hypothetical protein